MKSTPRFRNPVRSGLHRAVALPAILALATAFAACDRIGAIKGHYSPNPLTATPVYETNGDVIFNGSLYFAQAGCAKCHGVDFDGQGPDATATKNETGVAVPGFKGVMIDPAKTPLDYFKVITMGTEKMPSHANQGYTDRGRWAMAHFLYSLNDKPIGANAHKHEAALAAAQAEIRAAYEGNRRWVMGYRQIEDRPQPPRLDLLLELTEVTEEYAAPKVNDSRQARRDSAHPGHETYEHNCASCHGLYGEGMPSSRRFGLIECDSERNRQCGVYLATGDFAASAALGGLNAFQSAHETISDEARNVRSFAHMSDDEWSDLFDYAKSLAGR